MIARLSILGLPFSDSIRWRLLLGRLVSAANASNPTDAFTRSRRISRAVSGSPLRNSVAASSRSALAKAGSRVARSFTVSLKSRVSIVVSLSTLRLRRLPDLVFRQQCSRPLDVRLLPILRPAREQNYERVAILSEIQPVARPPVDLVFSNAAAEPFDVGRITRFQAQGRGRDLGGRLGVEAVEPFPERAGFVPADIFAH